MVIRGGLKPSLFLKFENNTLNFKKEVFYMYNFELPYISVGDKVQTVTTADVINLGGSTAVLHNVGPDVLYYSGTHAANTDSPELAVGEKTFPRTGKLNVLSAGTSKIKIEFVDAISS